jgi:glucose-1-phosphate thymidylyltransferase
MKGIILAGGNGMRLHPMTQVVSKQLLPVYDKPMIYYPLSILMLAGITEILVISTPDDKPRFQTLLGDGSRLGINLSYAVQPRPDGLAQAFIIGEAFISNSPCAMILGDNIFYGTDLQLKLRSAASMTQGAKIFAYAVKNPERYGVVEIDANLRPVSLEEKPAKPRSRYAVTGLYFFDGQVARLARTLKPSDRGELEVTDLIRLYMANDQLRVEMLGRGTAWLDTGTQGSLLAAANFVETIEERQGLKICCPEEIAFRMGYISAGELSAIARPIAHGDYGSYLMRVLDNDSTAMPGTDA